jgi:hypothetical protein
MLEKGLRLGWRITRLKTALHYEKYTYVAWVRLLSDTAPENDKSLYTPCATHRLVDMFQTSRDSNALSCAAAKVRDDLSNRGPIYSDGEIAQGIESRPPPPEHPSSLSANPAPIPPA